MRNLKFAFACGASFDRTESPSSDRLNEIVLMKAHRSDFTQQILSSISESIVACFLLFLAFMTTTVLRSVALKSTFSKHLQSELYPAHLRQFYAINSGLRKEGISAPQEISLANTRRLYEILGSPLDKIPTLHIGGTNGKVKKYRLHLCRSTWL